MTTSSPTSSEPLASPSGELDLRGEVCPYTFVRTRLALEALPLGSRLRIRVDHEPARRNVPRSATEWGQEVVSVTEDDTGTWLIEIVKRAT
jgi:TusA-related sulfurtransferase